MPYFLEERVLQIYSIFGNAKFKEIMNFCNIDQNSIIYSVLQNAEDNKVEGLNLWCFLYS